MEDKAEKIAVFRYRLIAPLVLETLPRGELTRRAQEIAARYYDIPHSSRRSVSVDALLTWALRYRKNGIAALAPKARQDRGQIRAVGECSMRPIVAESKATKPVRKDHNAGGKSHWMKGFFDRPAPPLWKCLGG